MSTPSSGNDAVAQPLSGNNSIDALLYGTRWISPAISYSFITSSSSWSTDPVTGYPLYPISEPWDPLFNYFTSAQMTAAVSALGKWAAVAKLNFSQVTDSGNSAGDIRFAFTDVGNAQAHTYSPGVGVGGDVWFSYTERNRSFAEGTYNYMTLVHEIGHALGLKHPFSPTPASAAVLPTTLDNQSATVMSYSALSGNEDTDFSYRPTTPMRLDIDAIQYLYGANYDYNAGNTLYTFAQGADYNQTIWDGGGIDTISYSGADNAVIDLRPGAGSTMGNPVYIVSTSTGGRIAAVQNVWIADAAAIENAGGGTGNDSITGNGWANKIDASGGNDTVSGGAGNDRIEGGAGADTAVYAGLASQYLVLYNATTGRYTLGDRTSGNADGIDVVSNVENFQFADGTRAAASLTLATPVGGNARIALGVSEAFYGFGPGAAQYNSGLSLISQQGASAFALSVGHGFDAVGSVTLAQSVLLHLGIEANTLGGGAPDVAYRALYDALVQVFTVYSDARGQVVLNMVNVLAGLETNDVYGQVAATLTDKLTIDYNNLGLVALVGVT
jgi:hypothetical protein